MSGIAVKEPLAEIGSSAGGAVPHIRVRNLNLFYGNHQALFDITAEAPNSRITAIIGPSGCGKTSLLKCLNRLIDLIDGAWVTGEVLVDGVNILHPRTDVTGLRQNMGLLSQRPAPLPMSIYDNVAYGPRIHGIRKRGRLDEIVERNLEAAGLWCEVRDRLKKPASRLSVGQQQRLCLARCLAVEPEIILADEPTSALDPVSAKKIADQFLELKSRYTIILVTHNLRIARRLADYVIFLYLGAVVEHGPKPDFFSNPREPKTVAYIEGEF